MLITPLQHSYYQIPDLKRGRGLIKLNKYFDDAFIATFYSFRIWNKREELVSRTEAEEEEPNRHTGLTARTNNGGRLKTPPPGVPQTAWSGIEPVGASLTRQQQDPVGNEAHWEAAPHSPPHFRQQTHTHTHREKPVH